MIVKKHLVQNYRNIGEIEIIPSENVTVISGENGQGKTNLLESIWLLSGAKSFRGTKDIDIIKKKEEFSTISSLIQERNEEREIKITIGSEKTAKKGRYAAVNGVDYGRATNLAGVFYCVVFEPGHLSLVKGSPAGKRKWVDASLCQLYPGYIETFKRYTRILQQKNALLRDLKKSRVRKKIDLLDVMDEHFAEYSAKVIERRRKYIENITPVATEKYENISRGKEVFSLSCDFSEEDKDTLLEKIKINREKEIRAGFSLVGPHRDDINFFINKEDAKIYASQGQQRSVALCLKLAEAQQIEIETEEAPVVLLDDVLSELDMHRQSYLLRDLVEKQVIITSCEVDFDISDGGKIYEIENGELKR